MLLGKSLNERLNLTTEIRNLPPTRKEMGEAWSAAGGECRQRGEGAEDIYVLG